MVTYASKAVPWALLTVVGVLLVGLMRVVAQWPHEMWPLEGCAVGLLAGMSAWCFDEPAAALVDTAPRHLSWRTFARLSGPALLLTSWLVTVWSARSALGGHADDVAWQGIAGTVGAVAYVTWRRSRGVSSPGRTAAELIIPTVVFFALVKPYPDRIPLFPNLSGAAWGRADLWWTAEAIAAGVLLAAVLTDRRWSAVPRN
jgi:hypothetical protein